MKRELQQNLLIDCKIKENYSISVLDGCDKRGNLFLQVH